MGTAVLSLHGIGDTPKDFDKDLITATEDMLLKKYRHVYRSKDTAYLRFYSVWYQSELKPHQNDLWDRLISRNDLNYRKLREFVVSALGDAATFSTKKELSGSVYERIQKKICLLYTSPSPRDVEESRMPSSA